MVTQRAVARGLARSASISRRARTSAATDSARPFQHAGQAGAAAAGAEDQVGGDQVAGGVVQVVGERAQRVLGDQRARSRATSRVTSGRIGAGVDRSVATSACSRPTPTVSTPDSDRVHSSIASSRSIRAAAGGADSSTAGRPPAAGTSRTSASSPARDQPRDDAHAPSPPSSRAGSCGRRL